MALKLALDQLGFGPCFHASELALLPDRLPLWVRAGEDAADWDAVFAGYRSTVDAPGCFFWRELAERYPAAKVLHSVRDPERWFESTQATVFGPNSLATNPPPPAKPFFDMVKKRLGGTSLQDREFLLERFKRHTEEVVAAIPVERLLVFDATEGWPPLCAFLGVPVPATPFPRVNVREQMVAVMTQQRNPDGTYDPEKNSREHGQPDEAGATVLMEIAVGDTLPGEGVAAARFSRARIGQHRAADRLGANCRLPIAASQGW